jgi:hypothetical protein
VALLKSECLGSDPKWDPKLFTSRIRIRSYFFGSGSKTRRKMGSGSEKNSYGSTTLFPAVLNGCFRLLRPAPPVREQRLWAAVEPNPTRAQLCQALDLSHGQQQLPALPQLLSDNWMFLFRLLRPAPPVGEQRLWAAVEPDSARAQLCQALDLSHGQQQLSAHQAALPATAWTQLPLSWWVL